MPGTPEGRTRHRSQPRGSQRLQERADESSGVRLPQLLGRTQRGEQVAAVALVPQGGQAADEGQRLAAAIDQPGHVAAESLARQSRGRDGTERIFAQLTRPTQTLIGRLVSPLDGLERKHEDSDLLKDLFQTEHLAARLRRHPGNLVLSGAPSNPRITAQALGGLLVRIEDHGPGMSQDAPDRANELFAIPRGVGGDGRRDLCRGAAPPGRGIRSRRRARPRGGARATPAKPPQRTRGVSLARRPRTEAGQAEGGAAGGGDDSLFSPAVSARAFSAIQQGQRRAQSSRADEPETADGSRNRGARVPINREGTLRND